MKKLWIGVGMMFLLTASGCGLLSQYTNSSALDKAVVTASQLTAWYQAEYKSVSDMYAAATPANQAWIRQNVNPSLNKIKPLIVAYVDSVNTWAAADKVWNISKTGPQPTGPANLANLAVQINTLCSDILTVVNNGGK